MADNQLENTQAVDEHGNTAGTNATEDSGNDAGSEGANEGETPPANETPQTDEALRAENARLRTQLSKTNGEAAKHRTAKREEHQKATSLEERMREMEQEVEQERRTAVAATYGLPANLASKLTGTRDEMTSFAEELVAFRGANAAPKTSRSDSAKGGVTPDESNAPRTDISALVARHRSR